MAEHQDQTSSRILFLDLLRAAALMGIALVNVEWFSHPPELTYALSGWMSGGDRWADGVVKTLFLAKAYAIFSIVFGASFAFQEAAAQQRGHDFALRTRRRLTGLAIIGGVHAVFLFRGDILVTYALMGALLYYLRGLETDALIRLGGVLVGCGAGLFFLLALLIWAAEFATPINPPSDDNLRAAASPAIEIIASGGFWEVAWLRARQWPIIFTNSFVFQGISVLGYFCLGLAAGRVGLFQDPGADLWRIARRITLPVGLFFSALGGSILVMADTHYGAPAQAGRAIMFTAAPLTAFGYMGLLAAWSAGPPTLYKRMAALAGRASLSAYLLQSLILSVLFCGYGFGLYGRFGAGVCLLIGLGAGFASLIGVAAWQAGGAKGPAEWLLRRYVYAGA